MCEEGPAIEEEYEKGMSAWCLHASSPTEALVLGREWERGSLGRGGMWKPEDGTEVERGIGASRGTRFSRIARFGVDTVYARGKGRPQEAERLHLSLRYIWGNRLA